MEGNPNDKALRDKLQSAEYPYDPAAWGQMELMLDAKKKRRGLFWWLASGAVAVSLIVTAGVYYHMDRWGDRHETSKSTLSSVTDHSNPSSGSTVPSQNTLATNNETTPGTYQSKSQAGTNTYIGNSKIIAAGYKGKKSKSAASPSIAAATSSLASRKARHITGAVHPQTAAMVETATVEVISPALERNEKTVCYSVPMEVTPINNINYNCFTEESGESVPTIPAHHRKKIHISYTLGVESGVYASFVCKTFADQPTWTTGLAQQVNIGKYFAITNSILYSEVNFKVNKPVYPDNQYSTLNRYSSHIREIAIPIGVKVYPYSSKYIRFGIGVSYVSHIKLEETFDYQRTTIPNTGTSNQPVTDNSFYDFPLTNNFVPDTKGLQSANNPSPAHVIADYYSIGGGRRYYGSMMYNASVEILLPKHFSISVDPAMRMSIGQIKMQDSRLFDFGMNAGVKYTF